MSLRSVFFACLLCVLGLGTVQAQDVNIPTVSGYLTLARGNSWGSGGACSSGSGCGVNNSYVWSPPTPDSTVCIAITNNNPTNSHAVTLVLNQTLDASVQTFSSNPGPWASVPIVGVTFPQTIPASSTVSFFFRSSSAAKLALVVSGTATAGGSPDTANITAVQPSTASFCGNSVNQTSVVAVVGATGAGNAVPASLNQPVLVGGKQNVGGTENNNAMYADVDSVTKAFLIGALGSCNETQTGCFNQTINNGNTNAFGMLNIVGYGSGNDQVPGSSMFAVIPRLSRQFGAEVSSQFAYNSNRDFSSSQPRTFQAQNDAANPAAGQLLLTMNESSGAANGLALSRVIVSCSAACDVLINVVSTAGTTCTAVTTQKPYDPSLASSGHISAAKGACGANPTVSYTITHIWLAAGGTQQLNYDGYYWINGQPGVGYDVVEGTALTGTASVTIEGIENAT